MPARLGNVKEASFEAARSHDCIIKRALCRAAVQCAVRASRKSSSCAARARAGKYVCVCVCRELSSWERELAGICAFCAGRMGRAARD